MAFFSTLWKTWQQKRMQPCKVNHPYSISFSEFQLLVRTAMINPEKYFRLELRIVEEIGPVKSNGEYLWAKPDGWTGCIKRMVVYYGTFLKCSEHLQSFRDPLGANRYRLIHLLRDELFDKIEAVYFAWDFLEGTNEIAKGYRTLSKNLKNMHKRLKQQNKDIRDALHRKQKVSFAAFKQDIKEYTLYAMERAKMTEQWKEKSPLYL